MAITGIDIAWATPSVAQIKATGAAFVARYFSPDETKNLTAQEVQDYTAASISVVAVYESTANRTLGGYAAGVSDAKLAESQRVSCGLPNSMPIYFACDFDAQGSQLQTVNDYMRGVSSVIGVSRTGFYGGYYTVESVANAGFASFFWQADAWSNGRWSAHACIRQDGGTVLADAADVDHAFMADYGQFPRPVAAPLLAPAPAPTQEDDMPTTDSGYLPTGFSADVNGNVTDRSKSIEIELPKIGDPRWGWTQVDLNFGCDFVSASEHAVKLRVAIHNAVSGAWTEQYITFTSTDSQVNVWLKTGDDKASVCRMPYDASDKTTFDVPVSWRVIAK